MVNQTSGLKQSCLRCGKKALITDTETGEIFCGDCGFVLFPLVDVFFCILQFILLNVCFFGFCNRINNNSHRLFDANRHRPAWNRPRIRFPFFDQRKREGERIVSTLSL